MDIVRACEELGCEPWLGKADWQKVADYLGISKNAARNRYRRQATEVSRWKPVGQTVSVKKGDKRVSVRYTLTENKNELDVDKFVAGIHANAPNRTVIPAIIPDSGLLVPNLFDLHLEKRGIGTPEDSAQLYLRILKRSLSLGMGLYKIGRIFLIIGQDFGNYDTPDGKTTAGTPQQNNGSYEWAVDRRCSLAVEAIEMCLSVAPTDVAFVPGNHDRYTNYWLGKVAQAWFRNTAGVTIDNNPLPRKYYAYGKNLFMVSHGDKEKNLPGLMPLEKPKEWAESTNREIFIGHLHGREVIEVNGTLVRRFPGLTVTDGWHNDYGYVGNKRGGTALIYNQEGLIGEHPILIREQSPSL